MPTKTGDGPVARTGWVRPVANFLRRSRGQFPGLLNRVKYERLVESGCALGCLDPVQACEVEVVRRLLEDGT